MNEAALGTLLARASALRDRLAGESRRIEALTRAVADEAWHAKVPEAKPRAEEARRFSLAVAGYRRTIDEELARLARLADRSELRTERTGT